MKRAAGEMAYSSLTLPELHSDQNRYELVGKLFNMSEETPNNKALDSSVFKNLVSGGEFMIKVVYKTPFKHKNKTKIILACNELPSVEDTTHGMFRRLLIVPFEACFTGKEDTGMEEKLCKELPGIFNKVVTGYRELLKNGGFVVPKEVEAEVADYRLHSDDVYYFVQKHCELQPQGVNEQLLSQMPVEEYYNKFSSYIQTKMNKKPIPFRNFQASIKRIMPTRLSCDTVWGVSVKHSGGAF
jgi:putative DNA primase/helicase